MEQVDPGVAQPRAATQVQITFDELWRNHLEEVTRYVSRRLASIDDVEDVTARTFEAAWQALPRFRGDCAPRLWLLSIARRKVADARRWRLRRRELLASELGENLRDAAAALEGLLPTSPGPEQIHARHVEARWIAAVLLRLKEDQREALLLKYVEGLSLVEISVVLGRSPEAVNSLLQRARITYGRVHQRLRQDEGADQ